MAHMGDAAHFNEAGWRHILEAHGDALSRLDTPIAQAPPTLFRSVRI